jgi:hypothetical protein
MTDNSTRSYQTHQNSSENSKFYIHILVILLSYIFYFDNPYWDLFYKQLLSLDAFHIELNKIN